METPKELRTKIVEKAAGDADFRALLLSDPKEALERELGVAIPESMSIEVHEDSATAAHLVLPPDSKLNPNDLQAAAGGTSDDHKLSFYRGDDWYDPW